MSGTLNAQLKIIACFDFLRITNPHLEAGTVSSGTSPCPVVLETGGVPTASHLN